jgi:hypothetical protein
MYLLKLIKLVSIVFVQISIIYIKRNFSASQNLEKVLYKRFFGEKNFQLLFIIC